VLHPDAGLAGPALGDAVARAGEDDVKVHAWLRKKKGGVFQGVRICWCVCPPALPRPIFAPRPPTGSPTKAGPAKKGGNAGGVALSVWHPAHTRARVERKGHTRKRAPRRPGRHVISKIGCVGRERAPCDGRDAAFRGANGAREGWNRGPKKTSPKPSLLWQRMSRPSTYRKCLSRGRT
jgi:hypothetical protein